MARVLINMVARQSFEHDGQTYACGEHFQVSGIVAAALKYQHKAEFAQTCEQRASGFREYRRRDLVAER